MQSDLFSALKKTIILQFTWNRSKILQITATDALSSVTIKGLICTRHDKRTRRKCTIRDSHSVNSLGANTRGGEGNQREENIKRSCPLLPHGLAIKSGLEPRSTLSAFLLSVERDFPYDR